MSFAVDYRDGASGRQRRCPVTGAVAADSTTATGNFSLITSTPGGTQIVKIAPDGSPETLWTSRDELVFSMGFSADGKPTSRHGRQRDHHRARRRRSVRDVAKTASAQVTSLATAPAERFMWLRPTLGKYSRSGRDTNPAEALSRIRSTLRFFRTGAADVVGRKRSDARKVAFYARSGNTSRP